MKPVLMYRSLNGKAFRTEADALKEDFRVLRRILEGQVAVLSVGRRKEQFEDIKTTFNAVYGKYKECRDHELPGEVTHTNTLGRVIDSEGRPERPVNHGQKPVTLKRVA